VSYLPISTDLTITDYLAGMYDAIQPLLAVLSTKGAALETYIYGDGTTAHLSLGDAVAIALLGPGATALKNSVAGHGFYTGGPGRFVTLLSTYLSKYGGVSAGLPAAVNDTVSYARYNNGCPDPSPAGNGAGSDYTYLYHPSFAALISLLTNSAQVLPPDVVFAPTGIDMGDFNAATATFTAGQAMMVAGTAPYAPAKLFGVKAGTTPPNGSLYVTVTGKNQAGTSVTWRGDVGTGLTVAGGTLAPGCLLGTSGGSGGGTAAPTDRMLQVTNIVRDTSVSGGGTATVGQISVIPFQERASL